MKPIERVIPVDSISSAALSEQVGRAALDLLATADPDEPVELVVLIRPVTPAPVKPR